MVMHAFFDFWYKDDSKKLTLQLHGDEVRSLIRNVEAREKSEHPLQRIMSIEETDGNLRITTTDIHLAFDICDALHHAYKGDLDFHYNKAEYLLRVHWQR